MTKSTLISLDLTRLNDAQAAKAAAEAEFNDCFKQMLEEKAMLDALLENDAEQDQEVRRISLKACRCGISAWAGDIVYCLNKIAECEAVIVAILDRAPELSSRH